MRKPQPARWIPREGEKVYVPATPKSIGTRVNSGTIRRIAGNFAIVFSEYGWKGKRIESIFELHELRPFPKCRSGIET